MGTKYEQARDVVLSLNRLLGRGAKTRRGERISHFEKDREIARSLANDSNILGFGVGPKLAGKDRLPKEICVVIFVRRKLPKSRLRHMVEVPKQLFLNTLGLKVRTDVQVWGHAPVAHSVTAGDSIGDLAGNAGTMTLAVIDTSKGGEGDPLLLGCSHVLANAGQGSVNDPVDSPAAPFQDPTINMVARLRRFSIVSKHSTRNEIDAAVAVPVPGEELSNNIPDIGTPVGVRDLRREGGDVIGQLEVQRLGVSTGLQSGLILNIHVSASIIYHQLPNDPSVRFSDLVQYGVSSDEGDSGAAVLDMSEQHNVVGMHIAGNMGEPVSLFTHIQRVFEIMELRFP